jgi:hypothetical protein
MQVHATLSLKNFPQNTRRESECVIAKLKVGEHSWPMKLEDGNYGA